MSWNWYLVVAYCAFFVFFFAYTVRMSAKQRSLDRRVEELKARLEDPGRRDRST